MDIIRSQKEMIEWLKGAVDKEQDMNVTLSRAIDRLAGKTDGRDEVIATSKKHY
jgi:hypothetical protein